MTGPCGLSVGLSLGAPGSRHMTAEPCQRSAVVQKPNRKDSQSGCPPLPKALAKRLASPQTAYGRQGAALFGWRKTGLV